MAHNDMPIKAVDGSKGEYRYKPITSKQGQFGKTDGEREYYSELVSGSYSGQNRNIAHLQDSAARVRGYGPVGKRVIP